MFYVISFAFGAALGSFVLLTVMRLNVAPILRSRSKCLSCGEALRASDLVPVVSYLFLRGRCRYCKVPFGKEALLVEVGYGVLFMLLYHFILAGFGPVTALAWLLYYSLLFVCLGIIGLYDYRHSYVPILHLSIFSVLSLSMLAFRYLEDPTFTTLLGPFIVALPFLVIWVASKGRALGFGDVLLYAAVGAFFGIEQGLAVLLLSVWIGAVAGVIIYLRKKEASSIPFVPFIVTAFLIVLFTDMTVFDIGSFF